MLLSVPAIAQQCQEWCWAASITMIATFYGIQTSQCTLASGRTNNTYNCCNYAACQFPPCDQPADTNMADIFFNALGIHGLIYARALTEPELALEISNGRPVMVGFQGPFSGHAVVISGFSPGNPAQYHLIDPYFGPFDLPYQQILNGPMGQTPWSASWVHLAPNMLACNYSFNPSCCK